MNNLDRRIERLEDRLLPKPEITGPYPSKTVSEEWVKEFRTCLNEFLSRYTPEQLMDYEKKLTEVVKGFKREPTRSEN